MSTSPRLVSSAVCALALGAASFTAPDAAARPPEGGYFGLGLGYGAASGDRGVPLKPGSRPVPNADEWVRTDFGSGMSFEMRFGYLIGPVAPEIAIFGHGTFDGENGAGYPVFQLRFHPLLLVDSLADLKFDANIYGGVGYVIGGYHHQGDDDGKGWDGLAITMGLGVSYQMSPRIHLGLDLKVAMPQYSSWIFDYEDDEVYEPVETPSTMILAPSLQLQAFF